MFLEREWEPPLEPPPRPKPRISEREERWLLRLIIVGALVSFAAPIGGASIVQAVLALFQPS